MAHPRFAVDVNQPCVFKSMGEGQIYHRKRGRFFRWDVATSIGQANERYRFLVVRLDSLNVFQIIHERNERSIKQLHRPNTRNFPR